ncbi:MULTISPECIES: extracellular catalytic domain type 1 short-chain-length polyhydroxyalkanoate depolymerase [unclassified Nocardia]|uniref:extracellular catalytic domain type 1 short-chain-length polyhydroxyalkanoate depolymerase n=1 Tax=unclassified Nocardia TaxID=2637762 RepID=UPI0033ABA7FC
MRIATLAAAAVTVVLLVAGIVLLRDDPGVATTAGTSLHELGHDGNTRSYRVYRPATLSEPAPLVVMLHGGLGTGELAQRGVGWDAVAEAAGFVVAYPDGVGRAWNAGGGCCGNPGRTGVDDVGFLTAMVDEIARALPIDRARIYFTGMSNGAMMAYAMACRTTLAAAVGAVAGTQLGDCAQPDPVSVIHVHGTDDENIRYDGAPGSGVARIDGPSVPELNGFWRTVDECAAPVSTSSDRVTTLRATCRDGRAVDLVTVAGAGHRWPGADEHGAIDATRVIWDFFAAHHR